MRNAISRLFMRVFYGWRYWTGTTPWDTNITPPELVELIEHEPFLQGRGAHPRALDLGCGTGTNALYLAAHGMEVVGIDFVPHAIERAKEKAAARRGGAAQGRVEFRTADVLAPGDLPAPFDLVLDMGCFHSLDATGRTRYAQNIARWTKPQSVFLLYAFFPHPMLGRTIGVDRVELEKLFCVEFALAQYADDGRSAWYRWQRK